MIEGSAQPESDIARERREAVGGIGRVARIGMGVAFVFVFCGIAWAALAPLSLAVMAQGIVVVEGSRRTVQHLEGGIATEILVRDGDVVQQGEPVLRLSTAQSDAALSVLGGQLDGLLALEARLIAERDGKTTLVFPDELLARKGSPSADEAMAGQQAVFDTRQAFLKGRMDIIDARRDQSRKSIAGLAVQRASLTQQVKLIREELSGVRKLYRKGLVPQPRLLALERQAADIDGRIGQIDEEVARIELEVSQFDLQAADLRATYVNEAVQQLRETQVEAFDIKSRLKAATDVANRLAVIAPVTGTVVGVTVHTKGQVVRPGETLMEIVPEDTGLVINASVRPEDAEDLAVGQEVEVYLTAYHQRRLPVIKGQIIYVSADRITDQRTGMGYYEARVRIDPDALKGVEDVEIRAGMPADIAIKTGDSTVLASLFAPITSVLDRGFREP